MAFNSYVFLLSSCPSSWPVTTRSAGSSAARSPQWPGWWAPSLVFYASLGPGYLLVLLGSVLMNYLVVRAILGQPEGSRGRRLVLTAGIVANLLLLGFYKYTGFLAENVNALLGNGLQAPTATYPVGLSFYTFIQIGFLLDAYCRPVRAYDAPAARCCSGRSSPTSRPDPLVRPRRDAANQLDSGRFAHAPASCPSPLAPTMFGMGLFKKVVLANSVAPHVDHPVQLRRPRAGSISRPSAWSGRWLTPAAVLRLLGLLGHGHRPGAHVRDPVPATSTRPTGTSLVDFWRRWHITMVRFFTSHVYTPMTAGIVRRTIRRRVPEPIRLLLVLCLPVFVTFVLVGFWHGAGWGFIISGAIHGVGLSVNLTGEPRARFRLPSMPCRGRGAHDAATRRVARVPSRRGRRLRHERPGRDGRSGCHRPGAGCLLRHNHRARSGIRAGDRMDRGPGGRRSGVPRNTQQIMARYDVALPSLPSPEPTPRESWRWKPRACAGRSPWRWWRASGWSLSLVRRPSSTTASSRGATPNHPAQARAEPTRRCTLALADVFEKILEEPADSFDDDSSPDTSFRGPVCATSLSSSRSSRSSGSGSPTPR